MAAGAAELYETAKHAVTDEPEHDPHLDTSSPPAAPTSTEVADGAASRAVEENNLNTKQDAAEQEIGPITAGEGEGRQEQEQVQEQEQQQDPFGAPSSGFGFAGKMRKPLSLSKKSLIPLVLLKSLAPLLPVPPVLKAAAKSLPTHSARPLFPRPMASPNNRDKLLGLRTGVQRL